ncbi:restriction endonuclease subunit S [Accumulibacter sp.]|uniref:restriction endonuclease subunit S n=1 Tax=Accumulibacter sp. TaxID=2053492 RepID=UPI0026238C11|nr:restriction endonuclease subunit S [Accumulibacter sp.]
MAAAKEMHLGDVVRFGNGKSVKPGGEGPYPVYGSNGIIGGSKEFRHENGVVIGRVGAYCGAVVYCQSKFWASDNTLVAYPASSHVDTQFLYYLLVDAKLSRYAGGAAQPLVTQTVLKQVEVRVPLLPVQQRIAGILSAYDELIENSQRRIKILESMARALYREWFVHFRFPGHEHHPRVASTLGEIPHGWEVAPFGELYRTSSGGTPSRKKPEYFKGGNTDWVKSQELLDDFILLSEERITDEALKNSSAKVFPANTVLIALYGATIGKLGILAREAATNQACCAVLPKDSVFGREFAFLTLLQNRERIIGLRVGAAQQNISQVLLKNMECIKPPGKLVRAFAERTSPLLNGTLIHQRQVENLRRTRDLLLPRLLSGQIELRPPEP